MHHCNPVGLVGHNTSEQNTTMSEQNTSKGQDKVIAATTAKELANTPILVSVLSEPSMPDPERPRKPIFWLNMVLAIVGGVILSLIYAFSADHFDHSLKSIDDAERYLGVPVLASVPKLGRKVIRTTGGG